MRSSSDSADAADASEASPRRAVEGERVTLDPAAPSPLVTDAVHGSVVIIGHEERAVLHDEDVHWPAEIAVVLDEPGQKRLHRVDAAVLVQEGDDHVPSVLDRPVPRAVSRDE